MTSDSDLFLFPLIVNMVGSVSLLLWGSFTVRGAMERTFSVVLHNLVANAASSPAKAVVGGMLAALMMQSATATVLLTTGLLSSGGLTLAAATAVILGADLGSAIATRILYLDLSLLPPVLLSSGLGLHLFTKTWRGKYFGRILIGLGLMLLAIYLMKITIAPLTSAGLSTEWLFVLRSAPWLLLVLTILVTWFAHSSVAIILVIAALAHSGLVPADLFIIMLLGANIGAGLIALPMVANEGLEARSAVLTNIFCRVFLALIGLALMSWIQIVLPYLSASVGTQVIFLHIAFNALVVIFFVSFSGTIATKIKLWLESRQQEALITSFAAAGSGLDSSLMDNPEQALLCARREALRLGDITEALFARALSMFEARDRSEILKLVESDQEINARNKAIHHYLSEVRRHVEDVEQEHKLDEVLEFAATMENIGDVISHGLSRLAIKRLDRGVRFSSIGHAEIESIHREVLSLLRSEINQFLTQNEDAASRSRKSVSEIKVLCNQSISRHRRRLSDHKTSSIGTSSIHQDTIRDLLQITFLLEPDFNLE